MKKIGELYVPELKKRINYSNLQYNHCKRVYERTCDKLGRKYYLFTGRKDCINCIYHHRNLTAFIKAYKNNQL